MAQEFGSGLAGGLRSGSLTRLSILTGAVSPRGRRAGGAASKLAPCVALELSTGLLVLMVRPLAPGEGARRESHVRVS